mgnify:CR=1 FL=1
MTIDYNKYATIIQKNYRNTDICGICFCLVKKNPLNCHHFHNKCLEEYSKHDCPYCKKTLNLTPNQLQKKYMIFNIYSQDYLKNHIDNLNKIYELEFHKCNICINQSINFLKSKDIIFKNLDYKYIKNYQHQNEIINTIISNNYIHKYYDNDFQLLPGTNWFYVNDKQLYHLRLVILQGNILYACKFDKYYANRISCDNLKYRIKLLKWSHDNLPYKIDDKNNLIESMDFPKH